MTRTFAQLQALCRELGLEVQTSGRAAKEPYIQALQRHYWSQERPDRPFPPQIEPMLLGSWNDLEGDEVAVIEAADSRWCVQEKFDGVRALLHIKVNEVRLTGRNLSDTTFRQSEFQTHVPHLTAGLEALTGTILDGELVCPKAVINTGKSTTRHPLQAVTALLATTPDSAVTIQDDQDCGLRFIVFDVLKLQGEDLTGQPLSTRLEQLQKVIELSSNPHIEIVETVHENKKAFHDRVIAEGKEGTVWKHLDRPYQTGRRVWHWLKRKKEIEVEAVVTDFTLGSVGTGNENLVGAVAFGPVSEDEPSTPIAWVSNWTKNDRQLLTATDQAGKPTLDPSFIGRRAIIQGQGLSERSHRVRHARFLRWAS